MGLDHKELNQILPAVNMDIEAIKNNLLKEPIVKKVVEDLELSDELIDNNLNTLYHYFRLKTGHEDLPDGLLLDDYDPVCVLVDQRLEIEYQLKKQLVKTQEQLNHVKNFWVSHLPKRLHKVKFSDIDFKHYHDIEGFLNLTRTKPNQNKPGLYLFGDIGIGKTFLMAMYANQMAKEGYSVSFINMNRLLSELKQSFNVRDEDTYRRLMIQLSQSDLLVVDDIGAEPISAWSRDEILFTILNERMENERLTCFTSNLSPETIKQLYLYAGQVEDEIKAERLMERFRVLSNPFKLVSKTQSLRRTT